VSLHKSASSRYWNRLWNTENHRIHCVGTQIFL